MFNVYGIKASAIVETQAITIEAAMRAAERYTSFGYVVTVTQA